MESEVFVYNLGTMFYIDKVLYNTIRIPVQPIEGNTNAKPTNQPPLTGFTSERDVEDVTSEFSEDIEPEVLFADATPSRGGEETTEGPAQNVTTHK